MSELGNMIVAAKEGLPQEDDKKTSDELPAEAKEDLEDKQQQQNEEGEQVEEEQKEPDSKNDGGD